VVWKSHRDRGHPPGILNDSEYTIRGWGRFGFDDGKKLRI